MKCIDRLSEKMELDADFESWLSRCEIKHGRDDFEPSSYGSDDIEPTSADENLPKSTGKSNLLLILGVSTSESNTSLYLSPRQRSRVLRILRHGRFPMPGKFRSAVWRDAIFHLPHFKHRTSSSPTPSWMRLSSSMFSASYSDCLYRAVQICHSSPSTLSSEIDLIESDIKRCGFSETDRASLRRILLATSVRCREDLGSYAQGMSFLAHTIFKTMNGDEESTFDLLVRMLRSELHRFDLVFGHDMCLLVRLCTVLDTLIKSCLPRLHAHFRKYELDCPSFAAPWFVTAFSSSLPCARRLWDTFLVVGWKAVFKVCVALLKLNHNKLIHKDMSEMMRVLKEAPSSVDEGMLFREAAKIKISDTLMQGLFEKAKNSSSKIRW